MPEQEKRLLLPVHLICYSNLLCLLTKLSAQTTTFCKTTTVLVVVDVVLSDMVLAAELLRIPGWSDGQARARAHDRSLLLGVMT